MLEFNKNYGFPVKDISEGGYTVRFVEKPSELEDLLKLRFQVFNLELDEGLDVSYETGKDEDEFDKVCDHLVVVHNKSQEVVGTYRMLIKENFGLLDNFYSDSEFNLTYFPKGFLENSVELGRACVAKKHRNLCVLYLLWKGIALYMTWKEKRYLFGCASLSSQDKDDAKKAMKKLRECGHMHKNIFIPAREEFECYEAKEDNSSLEGNSFQLPKLFKTYITFGSRVCSAPAIDRLFKTIDFLMVFDINDLDKNNYNFFFDVKGS